MNATPTTESDKIAILHPYSTIKMIRIKFQRIRTQGVGLFVNLALLSITLFGQTPPKKPEPQQPMGGVSTGAALNYTSRRTVDVVDPKAPMDFEDATDQPANAKCKDRAGTPSKAYIVEGHSRALAMSC